jgi:hypothetical protein
VPYVTILPKVSWTIIGVKEDDVGIRNRIDTGELYRTAAQDNLPEEIRFEKLD